MPPLAPAEREGGLPVAMPSLGQSASSLWEQTFTTILGKALRDATPPADPLRARPATINFTFDGGGAPVIPPEVDPTTPTDPVLGESALLTTTSSVQIVEIPWPCKVAWVHLWAFDAIGMPFTVTNALFDIWITQYFNFGGRIPMHGVGAQPVLAGVSKDDMNLTGWNTTLNIGDAVQCRLSSLTGAATSLAVTILDEAGNRVVFRAYEDAGGVI